MAALLAVLTAFMVAASPVGRRPAAEVELRYERPLGQVATYRLGLSVTGEQVSLGERLPVRWRAEVEYREEVIARGPGEVLWLRARGRPVVVEDGTGGWRGPLAEPWPELEVRLTETGEVRETSLAVGEESANVRRRALVSLMAQPRPVVLPAAPVAVGEEWEWQDGGARQTNRLVGLEGEGEARVARVVSEGISPLKMEERSEALGVTARLTGETRRRSELALLLGQGVPLRHQGEISLKTRSEVSLALPDGEETFVMESDLRVEFDLRLVSIEGKPAPAR
jgi:hypothetical protein